MPHERRRHVTGNVRKLLSASSIVALFGHRQVGKTTLVTQFSTNYYSLDLLSHREIIARDPLGFLKEESSNGLLIIDECQMLPELFPALKEHVRRNPRKGQLLLTGSICFSSRQAIRESLTGRYIATELLPFDAQEIAQKKLSNFIPTCLNAKDLSFHLSKSASLSDSELGQFLKRGTLPAFFAKRDITLTLQAFDTQIETLLNRDLKLLLNTSLAFESIKNVCVELSRVQGKSLEWAELRRATRVSIPTLQKIVQALESMFVIRRISSLGDEKKDLFFFEDQGEACHLLNEYPVNLKNFSLFLYQNMRTQWMYRPELNCSLYRWKTRNGSEVPFVLKSPKGLLGIIPILEANPTPESIGSASSLLNKYPHAKILYVHPGSKDELLGSRQRIVPAKTVLG